ncbi:RagB/SusD family nutrient uptake outer membrane protein [Flavobacteriaceae bacterium KMM 6897]|nr:RagB/SusD family nutrient uptake outer membrane protein [Flavobacteriaceae bacterium KMM 6897]MEB8346462.1 RagB/SusD family nutrient uptake outer membrane protein [Flavobacteriaceae bacterium KMM 6898]
MKIVKQFSKAMLIICALSITSCELEGGESLNGASTNSISEDLSRGELPQALSGVLSDMRVGLSTQTDVQSIFGREYYYFTSSDPRFEGDVVVGNLDDNTFYTTTAWASRYATVKNINLMLEGLENTTADFSTAEIAATKGVLNTLKAYELLMLTNSQHDNGIRLDVSDPDNLGPLVDNATALTAIFELLNNAGSDLSAGGSSFPFSLSSGYTGFDTPGGFLEFNKALTARVEAYRGNYSNVVSLLGESFMDFAGDLNTGVYHTFSLSGADLANPLFIALNQEANVRVAHAGYVADAEANDNRLDKVVLRDSPRSASGLVGNYDVWIYRSNEDNVPVIRNEELILLYAEANLTSNPNESLNAINIIRNAAGLPTILFTTQQDLEDEMITQRRYSLYGEGHRWVDMRRFGRLAELPNDRATDNVPSAVPVPATENQ